MPLRTLLAIVCLTLVTGNLRAQDIPAELLDDAHFREEFGVNNLTTPSIKKVFDQLENLGELPYDSFKRKLPERTPGDRILLAISLGGLIADGFFVVSSERLDDLEKVGKALVKHAGALGAGNRIVSHAKPLLDHSNDGKWDKLRDELAATQRDVEVEMVILRDVETVHFISFGGWLRAFEIACSVSDQSYTPKRAEVLKRVDIADYYSQEFSNLHPDLQKTETIKALRSKLEELKTMLEVADTQELSKEGVSALLKKVREMTAVAFPA